MLILSDNEVESLLGPQQLLNTVEAAMISYENKMSLAPKRMHIDHGEDTLLCMPSFSEHVFGTKLVSVIPGNASKNLPVTNGIMLLNDSTTGLTLAIMNASKLTALRTGAVGAIGIKYITPEGDSSIGLIGCGVQGMHQALFACCVRPINTIYCLLRTKQTFNKLKNFVNAQFPEIQVIGCATTEEVLSKTNIIITATTSPVPVLNNNVSQLEGKHFISIGSFKPSMQELPDAVYQLANELVIDSEFAKYETGDIINPVAKGFIKDENVFTIGKLILGKRKINTANTTVYKTTGMAIFDLFVSQCIYTAAKEKKIGARFSL